MPQREGGLFGAGGVGRHVVEAAVKRTLGVDIDEEHTLREQVAATGEQLVEAIGDLRLANRLNRRLGFLALNALSRFAQGQDANTENRLSVAERVRSVARIDSQMLYAIRLRIAFCYGRGVTNPKANDESVQVVLDDLWDAPANKAELTTSESQWRAGKDLFEVSNVYHVVFADGLDGRVLLAGLQHDQVIDVVRDPKVWRRVLYYVVKEYVYEWDFQRHAIKANPKWRTVYYEAFDGMAELEEDLKAGRAAPPTPPPDLIRPGRVLHVSINRGREQAFGEPEMRTNLKWAAAFNDLLAGQVEKAKAAQKYLMQVTVDGASSEQALQETAMRAVGRRSPLATAFDDVAPEDSIDVEPRAGAQWWQNQAMKAEPFNLDAGSGGARQDMESASQAFASGTNFPGHYFFGDPGSLAGSMAVELPVLKLTDMDQEVAISPMRKLCDLRIERAVKVGVLSERREPTEDEILAGIEVDPDGMIERDLTYQLEMPEPLRRNLPELMQLVVDTVTTFDPQGASEPMQRALVGYVFGELLEFPDTPALVERIFAEAQQRLGGGDPGGGGDPTSEGPDGKQHGADNPYGARREAAVVEAAEAAMSLVWERLQQDPDDEVALAARDLLLEAHDIPNAFGKGRSFGRGGRFAGRFHPGAGGGGMVGKAKGVAHRLTDKAVAAVKAGANRAFPNAGPRTSQAALDRYEDQQTAYAIAADPGREEGADAAWLKEVKADARRVDKALNAALGPDLAKYIDRKWGRDARVRERLHAGELTVEDAEQEAYEHYQDAEARRHQREALRDLDYGLNKRALPCFSCGQLKRRPSDVCEHCGDDPVQTSSGSATNTFASERSAFDRAYGYGGAY